MQMKKILSAAITFSLLFAHSAAAVELDKDMSLSEFQDSSNGLLIGKDYTFDGENGNLTVKGTLSENENAIDCTGNYGKFYFGVQNEGTLKDVDNLTADTVINTGTMTVRDVTITKTGADAYFMNVGEMGGLASVTINGDINVDSNGWVNNTGGAVMTLNGQNAVIGAELANDYGATLNINADTSFCRSLWNVYDATMNIADGVTVTVTDGFSNGFGGHPGGTINAGGANIVVSDNFSTFANSGNAEVGSISITGSYYLTSLNSGTLTVNNELNASMSNSGTLTYNGTKAINGNISNSGTLYATNGELAVTGYLLTNGTDSAISKSENENLTSLMVGDVLMVGSDSRGNLTPLVVEKEILAESIETYGKIKTEKLTVKQGLDVFHRETGGEASIEVNELVVGGENNSAIGRVRQGTQAYGTGSLIVHDKITIEGDHTIENYGKLLLDGENMVISGGVIENTGINWKEPGVAPYQNTYGIIAGNAEGGKIKNLTIDGTLNNTGVIVAETLNVAKGYDDTFEGNDKPGTETFNVDNLNILDNGDFALKNGATAEAGAHNYYDFNSVSVGNGAVLDADNKDLNVEHLQNNGALTAEILTVKTGEDNGESLTIEKLVVADSGNGQFALNRSETELNSVEVQQDGNLYVKDADISDIVSDVSSKVTAENITLSNTAELLGVTTVINRLTNNASNARIDNLVLGTDSVEIAGTAEVGVKNIPLTGAIVWQRGGTYKTISGNMDLSQTTVDVSGLSITETEGQLKAGQTNRMTLIDNNTRKGFGGGIVGTVKQNFVSGTTLQGTGEAALIGNDVVYDIAVSTEAQAQTHSAVLAQTAGLATVTGGINTVERAVRTMKNDGVNGFAAVGGGEYKYDTGSHIKTNDWHIVAGIGVRNRGKDGSRTEYGLFYDYGDGSYRTYDSTGRGSGDATYHGGGIFGKHTFDNELYVEGSFRAGRVENDADGIFRDALGNRYNFETNSNYGAFHAGIGKIFDIDKNDSLDVYGKFFYTHLSGDSFNAGGQYDIDSIDSEIMRVGARWNMKRGAWNHYLGVAYEYEFDGEASGTADGAYIRNSDIGGGSARFEIGTYMAVGQWIIGFNADAYTGQQSGFGGSITAAVTF